MYQKECNKECNVSKGVPTYQKECNVCNVSKGVPTYHSRAAPPSYVTMTCVA